jgi:flavorubredoxin
VCACRLDLALLEDRSSRNTHRIAEAIARGLRSAYVVKVVSVAGARYEHVGRYDLIVAGGPTHAHGMSRPDTQEAAINTHRVKAGQLKAILMPAA